MVQMFPVSPHQSEIHPNQSMKMQKWDRCAVFLEKRRWEFACRILFAASPIEMDYGVALASPVCRYCYDTGHWRLVVWGRPSGVITSQKKENMRSWRHQVSWRLYFLLPKTSLNSTEKSKIQPKSSFLGHSRQLGIKIQVIENNSPAWEPCPFGILLSERWHPKDEIVGESGCVGRKQ